jgi:hypothetical protein
MKSILLATLLMAAPPGSQLGEVMATRAGVQAGAASASVEEGASVRNGSDWVVQADDHVSGVSNALQITNPAQVSYDSLMDDTSEMKELNRKGIRKDSAQGQVLVSAAKDRVRRAAKTVMKAKGYCSVWKQITSKSGVTVPDITEDVRKKLSD